MPKSKKQQAAQCANMRIRVTC